MEGSSVLSPAERPRCKTVSVMLVMAATTSRRVVSNVYIVYTSRMLVNRPLATPCGSESIVVMVTSIAAVAMMATYRTDMI